MVSLPLGRMRRPRILRSLAVAAALFARLTRSFSRPSRNDVTEARTRSPAAYDCT